MAENTLPLFADAGEFYVYLYRDPRPAKRLAPLYVGKGKAANRRAEIHWRKGAYNPILNAIFQKLKALELEPIIEIVGWFAEPEAAYACEAALVKRLGRRDLRTGSLCNLTDGGEGSRDTSGSTGRKVSATKKARYAADPLLKIQLDAARIAATEARDTPEFRAARSAQQIAQWAKLDPAARAAWEANLAKAREILSTPESKAKKSGTSKTTWASKSEAERKAWGERIGAAKKIGWARRKAAAAAAKLANEVTRGE